MSGFLLIVIIIFCVIYIRKTPYGKMAVIMRSGKYLKTVQPNTNYFFNPKTDTVTLIDIRPQDFANVYALTSRDGMYYTIKIKFTYYITSPTKVANLGSFPSTFIQNQTSTVVKKYISQKNSRELSDNLSTIKLKFGDTLNSQLQQFGFFVKNLDFEIKANSSNADVIRNSKFGKVPCIHKDDTTKSNQNTYSSDNSIKEYSNSGNAIKNYDLSHFYNNPIKESLSFKNSGLYTLENEDSNVDPIKNL